MLTITIITITLIIITTFTIIIITITITISVTSREDPALWGRPLAQRCRNPTCSFPIKLSSSVQTPSPDTDCQGFHIPPDPQFEDLSKVGGCFHFRHFVLKGWSGFVSFGVDEGHRSRRQLLLTFGKIQRLAITLEIHLLGNHFSCFCFLCLLRRDCTECLLFYLSISICVFVHIYTSIL